MAIIGMNFLMQKRWAIGIEVIKGAVDGHGV